MVKIFKGKKRELKNILISVIEVKEEEMKKERKFMINRRCRSFYKRRKRKYIIRLNVWVIIIIVNILNLVSKREKRVLG